jgi:N-acetylglucosaminyl-diphospho-decaprenol L-rhamnosyltransferase
VASPAERAGSAKPGPHDLAIVIVSTNEARWLEPCLSTIFASTGGASLDVVVVDNESSDGTRELVTSKFPDARLVKSSNRGFSHANNRGADTCDARYILFLNPDTEIVSGNFAELVAAMDERPDVGLVGVRQLTEDGVLWPTIRYFPSPSRALGEALASERWPVRARWAGERELDMALYEREQRCDWTSGSFMLARREALLGAGLLDERFFIYSEETDLCLRVKNAGWDIRHLPTMTIVHHAGKGGVRPKMVAQDAYARRQYASKHFTGPQRAIYLGAVFTRHALRALAPGRGKDAEARRAAARTAIRTLVGKAEAPFGHPPATAVASLRRG